jgi:hypothetical protein
MSIDELQQAVKTQPIKVTLSRHEGRFLSALNLGLLKLNFLFKLRIDSFSSYYLVIERSRDIELLSCPLDKYQSFLLLEFEDESILSHVYSVNTCHWLGKWIVANQDVLIKSFSGYLDNLLGFIIHLKIKEINEVIDHFNNILPEELRPGSSLITQADFVPNPLNT